MNDSMPKDKRVQKNINSVLSLINLLEEIKAKPYEFIQDDELFKVLKRQSELASYSNNEKGITGCSLNTVKRICNEWLYFEFEELDRLRNTAFEKLQGAKELDKKPDKRSRAGLAVENRHLKNQNCSLEQTNFLLIKCCTDAIGDMRSIASGDSETVRKVRAKAAIDKIVAILCQNVDLSDCKSPDIHHLSK